MSLENVKVGDWIKVKVTEISEHPRYPIRCGDMLSFAKNGAYYCDSKQVAFPVEQTERWMLVSDNSVRWVKRKVISHINGYFLAWNDAKTDEQIKDSRNASGWRYAKEIETKIEFNLELSLEEIAEKFGVNVEQIKIKK
jgi:hypothetical protein